MQVLQCLHATMTAVRLQDPLLRVSVGLRLTLHFETKQDKTPACSVIKEVGCLYLFAGIHCPCMHESSYTEFTERAIHDIVALALQPQSRKSTRVACLPHSCQ